MESLVYGVEQKGNKKTKLTRMEKREKKTFTDYEISATINIY